MRKLLLLTALVSGVALAQPAATGQFLLRIQPTRADLSPQNMTAEETRTAGEHFAYLKSLLDSGKLRLAAQVFDPKGLWGIIIVNAADRESAAALLDGDPGIKAKLLQGEVVPIRIVLEKPAEAPK